jgi:hypothetical protein
VSLAPAVSLRQHPGDDSTQRRNLSRSLADAPPSSSNACNPSPPLAVCLVIIAKAKRKQNIAKHINILLGYREILICLGRVDPAGRVTPTLRLPVAAARLRLGNGGYRTLSESANRTCRVRTSSRRARLLS